MDLVGIGIVATFFSMLFVSAFAVQIQAPPSDPLHTDHYLDTVNASYPAGLPSTVIG